MFQKLEENMLRRGYSVKCFSTAAEAADALCEELKGCSVGFGGSLTLDQLGLYERLLGKCQLYWHWRVRTGETADAVRMKARTAKVYLASVNAISEDGEIVNIDGSGNRVSEILYGHEKVILVVGKNKIAPDLSAAIERARNVAAPQNAKRLGCKTPCAVKGDSCYDCRGSARICRALTLLWEAPTGSTYEVILIDEALGF